MLIAAIRMMPVTAVTQEELMFSKVNNEEISANAIDASTTPAGSTTPPDISQPPTTSVAKLERVSVVDALTSLPPETTVTKRPASTTQTPAIAHNTSRGNREERPASATASALEPSPRNTTP